MSETVLITGVDGYIGHPLALNLVKNEYRVIGIDNFSRRHNVKLMGSDSAIHIQKPDKRTSLLKSIGEYTFFNYTIINPVSTDDIFRTYKPSVIINLAQQPSAPFSHKSRQHTINTTVNNISGVINLLYSMKKHCPNSHLIHIGTMGEYDPACNVRIPEGFFKFWYKFRRSTESFFPRRPGSFYHASKVASTYYIDLACRSWGLRATDIMQGIVFGAYTPEINRYQSFTRLDADEAFGTVLHRFVIQAVMRHPLTIYGDGKHSRGFLSLEDSVSCLTHAVKHPPKEGQYRTWNQFFLTLDMNTVARTVLKVARNCNIQNPVANSIPTPRTENTNSHFYKPETSILKSLGFTPNCKSLKDVENEISYIFSKCLENPPSHLHPSVYSNPKITWRKE